MTNTSSIDYDVIIVGGGISGLIAADALLERGKRVLVIERDRWGGRLQTERYQGTPVETGPTYIGPTQRHMQHLVRRFGLTTLRTFFKPGYSSVNHFQLGPVCVPSHFEGTTHVSVPGIEDAITNLDQMTARVASNLDEPWLTPGAVELDAMSVEDWAKRGLTGAFSMVMRRLLETFVRSILSVELREISMLYFLYYCARCGGFRYMTSAVDYGPDSLRIVEGNSTIIERLVDRLESGGATLVQGTGVSTIEEPKDAEYVCVSFGSSTKTARYVIVAVPPKSSLAIRFRPELPEDRRHIASSMKMGRTFKGFVFYPTPWWRGGTEHALSTPVELLEQMLGSPPPLTTMLEGVHAILHPRYSGYTNGDCHPIIWTMDATWEDPTGAPLNPAIMWFATADFAKAIADILPDQTALQRFLHGTLVKLFRGCAPDEPLGVRCYDHYDGGAGAGPAGVLPPGVLTTSGPALRRAHGRVHWAGTEVALYWGGYLEGAADAGLRAAQTVDRLLGGGVTTPFWPEF